MEPPLHTVCETPEFIRVVKTFLTEAERFDLIASLSVEPGQGVPLGSGVRKQRVGRKGAYRVVFWWYGPADDQAVIPVFMLFMFGKSDQANLTTDQQRQLRELGSALTRAATEKLEKKDAP